MERNADTIFHRKFEAPYDFPAISERGALKLTSILGTTAPRHFELWLDEIGGPNFFETGLFVPVVSFDFFVTDHPIARGEPFEIDVTIRLGRQEDENGQVRRLLSESLAEVFSKHAKTGERVLLARNLKHNALSRNDADPKKRRVTELPPSMNLGKAPARLLSYPSVDDLAVPPAGYTPVTELADPEPNYWSYQQTDMNQHINAAEYLRVLDSFVVDHLAKHGESPRDVLIERARVAYRKPCFTGESYRRQAVSFAPAAGEPVSLVYAGLSKGGGVDDTPVVAAQMFLRRRPT